MAGQWFPFSHKRISFSSLYYLFIYLLRLLYTKLNSKILAVRHTEASRLSLATPKP